MQNKSVLFQEQVLEYSVVGNGLPVVLLHGFGEDGRIFDLQVQFLQEKVKLIVPDLPGSGRSPYNAKLRTMDDFADGIKAILDKENISECVIIGHSMGGYIILAFVEKYQQLVSKYGLFHSSAFADDESKVETRRKGIDFIQEHGATKFLRQTIPNMFGDITKQNSPGLVSETVSKYSNFTNEALVQYYEAMIVRPDRTEVLKSADKPVLLILGEQDNAIPLDKGLQQAHIPEICYIHICKSSGHLGMLEEPGFCNAALAEFLGV